MAILSSFYTRNWQITLNRVEASVENALVIGDFTISGNSVTSISGTGLTRNIVPIVSKSVIATYPQAVKLLLQLSYE